MRLLNETTGKVLADNLEVADTLFARMKGLLGRTSLARGEGLLIKPCMGIHTFGMRFPIDAIYLDKRNRVVEIRKNIPPNRMTGLCFSASSVIELPAGALELLETSPGDTIDFT